MYMMRKGKSILSFSCLFFSVCILFLSCSSEREYLSTDRYEEEETVQVGFHIAFDELSDTRTVTRAGRDGYDNGMETDFENYINFENQDFRILFFDKDNKYISTLQLEGIMLVGNAGYRSKYYDVVGNIRKPLPSTFKVVMLANWREYPKESEMVVGQTTIKDICISPGSQYSYVTPSLFHLSEDCLIPMYGVKLFENVKFYSNMCTYLGTLHMLRAMAKVEVNYTVAEASGNTSDYTLKSVTLHRYNSRGYCAPDNVFVESDYVKGDYDKDYVDDLHLPDGKNDSDEKELPFEELSTGTRFVLYIPEYQNLLNGNKAVDAAEIHLKFAESDQIHTIDFKYYDNAPKDVALGTPFDIHRNYYYKFNVTKTYIDKIDVHVQVVPYAEVELEPDFGLDPKSDSNN